jgi:hypothetical protein
MRDRSIAEISICQHIMFTRNIHASGGIRTHNSIKRAAADPRLRPRGHCDWAIRNNCWKLRDIVLATKRDPRFHKQKLCNLSQGFKRSQFSRVHNYFLWRRHVTIIQGHFRIPWTDSLKQSHYWKETFHQLVKNFLGSYASKSFFTVS